MVANIEHARSNQALTQSVDRRIGYLGEQLVEVIEEGTVLLREAREGSIDAHGSQGHTALFSHGANHFIHVIPVVAQLSHAYGHGDLGIARCFGLGGSIKIGNFDLLFLYPIAIGLFLCIAGTQLVIPDNAIGRSIDFHHFTRTKTACGKDVGGLDFDGSNLRGKQEAIVTRDVVAGRTQAVAIERSTERGAIGVGDSGRTIPRLHEHGLVFVIGTTTSGKRFVVVPRLGQQHGNGASHIATIHHQELEHIIEDGGVGALFVDDRQNRFQILAQNRRVQVWFAGTNPVHIAFQRVDFAVMNDVTIRMSALPRGGGVRGVARMNQRDCGLHRCIGKVQVETTHLGSNKHALVHNGARTERAYVEDMALQRMFGIGSLFHHTAAYIQTALERFATLNVFGATYECLQDGRHAGTCGGTQIVGIDGNLAPKQQGQTSLRTTFFENALGNLYATLVLGEKEHSHAIVAFIGKKVTVLLRFLAEEVVRNLEQDTGAIARIVLQTLTTAMLQIDKDRKGIVDHLMRAHTLQMCQRANTARIMLELRTIQPALRRHVPCLHSEPLTLTIEKPLGACPLRSTTYANRLPFPF